MGMFDEVSVPIETAIRLRNEIASSPVDDSDAHRSAAHKANLLRQANEATQRLREIADAIVATGLQHGGKPGKKLDDAYRMLENAILLAFSGSENRVAFDQILDKGLTPEVETVTEEVAHSQPEAVQAFAETVSEFDSLRHLETDVKNLAVSVSLIEKSEITRS